MNALRTLRTMALAVVTPVLEKNMVKALAVDAKYVFSMTRLIRAAFAAALVRHMWHTGVDGWPDATLCIALVLADRIEGAMDRMSPAQVIELSRALLSRFGIGGVRRDASYEGHAGEEPSKFDDHRADD